MIRVVALMLMVSGAANARPIDNAASATGALDPVPVMAMIGRAYPGQGEPSLVRFINMRTEPVRVMWIDRAGIAQPYRLLAPGEEYVQPTCVTHRWLIQSAADAAPIEGFIALRPAAAGGDAQIALIR